MLYDYEERLAAPVRLKAASLQRDGRLSHVIFSKQFDRDLLDHVCDLATRVRELARLPEGREFLGSLINNRRAMLYFTQPSTRTFLSFMAASQMLGLDCNEIRDPSLSSEYKGESTYDSIRMFSSYFDLIIMRSPKPRLAEESAYLMNDLRESGMRSVPIINGGSGADEHPTQALLDIYTARRSFDITGSGTPSAFRKLDHLKARYPGFDEGLDGKTYCFAGDVGRGRTVRSLANLLSLYQDVTIVFVSPDDDRYRIQDDLRQRLHEAHVTVREETRLDAVIDDVDLLYMTRIQREWDKDTGVAPGEEPDLSGVHLSDELVARMREYAPILHPFPRNEEIPTSIDTDPRAMYFRQARNGIWVRAALIAYLFAKDTDIVRKHSRFFSERHAYNLGG